MKEDFVTGPGNHFWHGGEPIRTILWSGQGLVAHEALQQYMCTGSSNPIYGDEVKNKRQHMHGPTGTAPGELAARSLSLCARIFLPCITGMLEPDQTRYRSDPRWDNESTVAENFDRGYESPIQTPTTVALRGKNLHRDICVCIIHIPNQCESK